MSSAYSLITDLPTRLKVARGDLSQPVAARQLKISLRTLQAWEAGSAFPQPRHREQLSRWLAKREQLRAGVTA